MQNRALVRHRQLPFANLLPWGKSPAAFYASEDFLHGVLRLRVKKALVIVVDLVCHNRTVPNEISRAADLTYRSTLPSQVPTTFFLDDSLYQCFETVFARV